MDVPQAYDYLAAKGRRSRSRTRRTRTTPACAVLDEKTYKPTFEPFRLGTMADRPAPKPAKS